MYVYQNYSEKFDQEWLGNGDSLRISIFTNRPPSKLSRVDSLDAPN